MWLVRNKLGKVHLFRQTYIFDVRGFRWPLPYFLHPTSGAFAQNTTIFRLGLQFDLNYTPVKFCDYILHDCDAIALSKYVHRHTNTWRSTRKHYCYSSCYNSCPLEHIFLQWHTHTHTQANKVKTIPDALLQLVIISYSVTLTTVWLKY